MANSSQAVAASETTNNAPAAYVPFRTFLGAIDALEHGLPKRLDRTIWRSQSGVVQSQIMMALRFFGLVDDEDRPTVALQRLVDGGQDKRREQIAALLHHAYRDVIQHDLTKMSPKMLEEAMDQYHVSGDTKKKAVRFFLQAARFADLPMHPLLQGTMRTPSPRKRRAKNGREVGGEESQPPKPPVGPQSGSTKTVELKSGGKLSLSIDVDVFSMSAEDRQFVFGLIDKLQEYAGGAS